MSSQLAMFIKSLLYNVIVLFMFFHISWKMTLFTIGIMLPSMLFGPTYGKAIMKLNKKMSDNKAAATSVAENAISNIKTVKSFATEDFECTQYSQKNNEIYDLAKIIGYYYGGFNFVM